MLPDGNGSVVWGKLSSFKAPPYPGQKSLQRAVIFGDMGKVTHEGRLLSMIVSNRFDTFSVRKSLLLCYYQYDRLRGTEATNTATTSLGHLTLPIR